MDFHGLPLNASEIKSLLDYGVLAVFFVMLLIIIPMFGTFMWMFISQQSKLNNKLVDSFSKIGDNLVSELKSVSSSLSALAGKMDDIEDDLKTWKPNTRIEEKKNRISEIIRGKRESAL